MKIVMVADQYPPIVGGTERQAQKLSEALAARGHDVVVLTGRWRREMPAREISKGVRVERVSTAFSMGGIRGLRKFGHDVFAWSLQRALRRELPGADVVHCHFMRGAAVVSLHAGRRAGVPVLVKETSSGLYNSFGRLASAHRGEFLRREFMRHLRHVAVLSEEAARDYENLKISGLKIHRVVNGIEVTESNPRWTPKASRTILFVGRLHSVKGTEELVRAFVRVRERIPGWTLALCGDGPDRPLLENLVRDAAAMESVEFHGTVADPLERMADAGFVVLPSRAEGMSNTLLEAMSVGAPCLATEVGANADMLSDGCGWTVPAGDEAALADMLVRVAQDESERVARGLRAFARVRERYCFSVVAESYENLYRSLR